MAKWAHSAQFVKVKGKTKAQCACGAQSPMLSDISMVREWYTFHTRLVERQIKRAE